jgi:Zn-dependent protease with chaperone function
MNDEALPARYGMSIRDAAIPVPPNCPYSLHDMIANFWLILTTFIAASMGMGAVLWFYARALSRLPADLHWSEVARHYWHLRIARTLGTLWIVIAAAAVSYRDLANRGDGVWIFMVAAAALAGCIVGSRVASRGLPLSDTVRRGGLRATLTHLLLFPGWPSLFLVMALTIRRGLGAESLAIAGAAVLLNVVLMLGGSVAILRMTGLLKPVDEPLQRASREQAAADGVPLRHVLQMDLPMANAFAFPWTKDLGFTRSTLAVLNGKELHSVIAHELGHLKEGLATRGSRLIGLLAFFTFGLAPAAFINGQPLVALGLFAGYLVVSRIASRVHKRLEVSADEQAHRAESEMKGEEQEEVGAYASALEKIHKANLIPAVLAPRSPYPSLYDRMISAGVTPDFPRPEAPRRLAPMLCGLLATGLFFFLLQTLHRAFGS